MIKFVIDAYPPFVSLNEILGEGARFYEILDEGERFYAEELAVLAEHERSPRSSSGGSPR